MFPSSFPGESGRAYSKRDLYERGHVAVCSHKQVSSPCSSSSTSSQSPPSRRSASPSSCSPPSFYLRLPSPLPARGTVSYMMDNLKRVDYVKLVLCVFDIVFLQNWTLSLYFADQGQSHGERDASEQTMNGISIVAQ